MHFVNISVTVSYTHLDVYKRQTDDSALVEMKEGSVHLVATEDGALNIKLTTPADIDRIKKQPTLRTGMGYDAHRLVEGRKLILLSLIHI